MAREEQKAKGGGLGAAIINNNRVLPNGALINTLKTHFQQFFDANGDFKTDKFLEELKTSNINEVRDGYKLSFIGKDYAKLQTGRASETMIAPDRAHNDKAENKNSANVFITGDNIEALRHLQNAYENKIKMIYIDPPYNTGQEFVYNDKFEFDDEKLKNALGYNDNEIARLKSIQGRSSHSAWLTFMYPRLKIAQKLLKDDGVIFVSIDDNEQANLKLLMDDIFGEGNFAALFPWRKRTAKSDVPFGVSQDYEWILCYAKTNEFTAGVKGGTRKYFETADFPNRPWRLHDLTSQRSASERPNSFFTMIDPKNGAEYAANPNRTWAITKDTFEKYYEQKRIIFPGDYDFLNISKPSFRYFKDDDAEKLGEQFGYMQLSTLLPKEAGLSQDGTKDFAELFDNKIFSFPKPTALIKHLINAINHFDKNAIILDFFAGSGTTAQAVIELNAEDGGNRQFIMVQLDEPTNADSEARKAGYNTIDEIARERIKRAAQKIKSEAGLNAQNLDCGFKHFRLITPDIQTIDKIIEFDPTDQSLFNDDMITPFAYPQSETNGLDTLLATWLIDDGFTFNTHIENIEFAQYTAHYVKEAAIVYLINQGFDTHALKSLLNKIGKNELCVNTIVIYPYSFSFEVMRELKTNIKTNLDNPPIILERY
ncbi:MAG: site-specific DNA-methyltransferase [Helicobacteraceae bacterium]|nr:site-specific DNA-methyltransferase [Helicobacteraceae bacterium]